MITATQNADGSLLFSGPIMIQQTAVADQLLITAPGGIAIIANPLQAKIDKAKLDIAVVMADLV